MIQFAPGDQVLARYVDALGTIITLAGIVDRYDAERRQYWVKLTLGCLIPFNEGDLKGV